MDIYIVPVGSGRFELYCEPTAPETVTGDLPPQGWFGRLTSRFAEMVRAADAHEPTDVPDDNASWWTRLQGRMIGWVAERIAEQRLLWNLRHASAVTLYHPPDLTEQQARTLVQRTLRRDYARHRLWLIINGVLLLASTVLALVPGPNVIAYYLGFRVVGHWLSIRGALRGLGPVVWTPHVDARLAALLQALEAPGGERDARLTALTAELGLPRLARFLARVEAR